MSEQLWTGDIVKSALVFAHQVCRDTEGRVGPAKIKGMRFTPLASYTDILSQLQSGEFERSTNRRNRARVQHTSTDISLMQRVMVGGRNRVTGHIMRPWLSEFLNDAPEFHLCLWTYIMCVLHHKTHSDACQVINMSRSTYYRYLNNGAKRIATGLNVAKEPVLIPASLRKSA